MTKEVENHDHEHDHDEDVDVIYLTFENDEEVECQVMGVFKVEDKEYMALFIEAEEAILLYEYKETDEDFDLIPIEDEKELELVTDAYIELFEDDLEYGEYEEDEEED